MIFYPAAYAGKPSRAFLAHSQQSCSLIRQSPAMDAGIPDWLVAAHKKRNGPQSPFLTACGDPQICFRFRQLCTYRRNKKSAKRLPCLYMVSSDTTYNPKQRMPRPSSIQAAPEPAACGKCGCSGYFHTGYPIISRPLLTGIA